MSIQPFIFWPFRLCFALIGALLFSGCGQVEPVFPGSYGVGHEVVSQFSVGKAALYGELYFPSADGATFAEEAKPAPLVVFVPGYLEPPLFYQSYGKSLASWGYATLVVHFIGLSDQQHLEDIAEVLSWCRGVSSGSGKYQGAFDTDRIGLVGHSLGGKYALLASLSDSAICAVVALDPVDGSAEILAENSFFTSFTPERMPEVRVPVCILGAELPGPFNPTTENYEEFYRHATCMAEQVTLLQADHASFLDNIAGLVHPVYDFLFHGDPSPDRLARSTAIRYMVSWLNVFVRDQKEFWYYLTGPGSEKDCEAGIVEIAVNFKSR